MNDFKCPDCGSNDYIGIQYHYSSPDHYDGLSECECSNCGTRIGRWSGKKLAEGETEKVFGGK